MPEPTFTLGEFQPFVATRQLLTPGHDLPIFRGEEVSFDGARVVVRGQEYTAPALRGAVRAGWLVPKDEYGLEFAQFKPLADGERVIMLGQPLSPGYTCGNSVAGVENVTVTEGKNYIVCRRQNVWERLRSGGALYEPCP